MISWPGSRYSEPPEEASPRGDEYIDPGHDWGMDEPSSSGRCMRSPASTQARQHVRPLGDDGDAGGRAVLRQAIGDRLLDARGRLDQAAAQLVGGEPLRDHLHLAAR